MRNIIFFISIIFCTPPLFADEEARKAEFKKLYAEFNELYANSDDLGQLIEIATELHELGPKVYGRYSQNAAAVTYNLATLYDEAGGSGVNQYERTAVELYKKYFKILDRLKSPKDKTYLDQYKALVIAEFNYNRSRSKNSFAKNALNIAYNLNLSNSETADFEYLIAYQRYQSKDIDFALPYFKSAKERYIDELGFGHVKVGRTIQWIAKIYQLNKKYELAENNFRQVIDIYENMRPQDDNLTSDAYQSLAYLLLETNKLDEAAKLGTIALESSGESYKTTALPVVRVAPGYPARAAESGINGWVLVEFSINDEGYTEDVTVIESSHKMFEISSVRAARGYRYIPRMQNDKRVTTKGIQVRIEFQLTN